MGCGLFPELKGRACRLIRFHNTQAGVWPVETRPTVYAGLFVIGSETLVPECGMTPKFMLPLIVL